MTESDATAEAGDTRRPPSRRMTVQGWFLLVLSVMGLLVIVGTVVGSYYLRETTEASNYVRDRIQPARAEAYRLQGALLNQETGARGYILAADPDFLSPYEQGRQEEAAAAAELRTLVGDDAKLLADLRSIEVHAAEWRRVYAEPLVSAVMPGEPRFVDPAAVDAGRVAFDRLREAFEVQNADLLQAKTEGIESLEDIRATRDRILAGMVGVFLLTGVGLAVLLQMIVVRPIQRLRQASRAVIAGANFGREIEPQGPADIYALGRDVEDMRERIVHELQVAHEREEQLESQATELRRSNSELEQFAYVASHDLQEPLRKVASFCQLLEKRYGDKLDERGTQYIAFAVDGAKRMQVLINDLLTFSRVGRVSDAHVRTELDVTLDAALTNISHAVEESGAKILRPDSLPTIVGDPTLMIMLWQNLIGNAIKFRHEDRPVEIRVACEEIVEGDDELWRFSVQDNGIGIAEEFADKVFVIFQRLHGRDVYTGTGIGLAICRKIVEYHGGEIWLDPQYREGSRFCFTIPKAGDDMSATEVALKGASA
ncbi:two component system sensor kinase [Rhodococcus gordoniae]|uniref:histidine kinase n=2 Tax=Rhodococcus gordoniae TaxID=223392 RepID=A0A379LVQ2_9NOCA|nr:two component system sensor kinase [Rhodococcus gordoniae]